MATRKTAKAPHGRPTYSDWKQRCNLHAAAILPGLGNLFATDDPYDLADVAKEAFNAKQTPAAFVDEQFAEDISRKEYDEDLAAEAELEFHEMDFEEGARVQEEESVLRRCK